MTDGEIRLVYKAAAKEPRTLECAMIVQLGDALIEEKAMRREAEFYHRHDKCRDDYCYVAVLCGEPSCLDRRERWSWLKAHWIEDERQRILGE